MSPVERRRVTVPNWRLVRELFAEGCALVGGLDEVGRGAWAGPVTIGIVVVEAGCLPKAPRGVRDSKLLAERARESLYGPLVSWCPAAATGEASPQECDELGMTAALGVVAGRALAQLAGRSGVVPDAIVVDGPADFVSGAWPGGGPVPEVRTVVGGDKVCISVAAASVLAKVTRDRLMRGLSPSFPAFDFDRNKGYPSPVHRRALAGMGLTSLHRRSWSYVADVPLP